MNREETIALLKLRLELTGHNFGAGMLDTWAELLEAVDRGEAVVAMRRACTKKRDVQWPDFHAELAEHQHAKLNRSDQHVYNDCADCDGSNFTPGPDGRMVRCQHLRRHGPVISPQEGIPIALVALETELRRKGWDEARITAKVRATAGLLAYTYLDGAA
jgi:hypothetical protein